jgi:DNA repair protein RadC
LLDSQLRCVTKLDIFKGTVDECVTYPREIFRPVITHSSFGFVLVHNHPSGSVHPSAGDVRVTKRIAAGARMLKINFLDHVIVGQPIAGFLGYFSFHEAGLLRRQNKKTKNL